MTTCPAGLLTDKVMEWLNIFRGIERLIIVSCIPFLLVIGYKLFMLGATGQMQLSTKLNSASAKLTNVAPGSLCFVLAVVLGAYSLFAAYRGTYTEQTNNNPAQPNGAPDLQGPKDAMTKTDGSSHTIPQGSNPAPIARADITKKMEWSYLGGGTTINQLPLSYKLRVALNDLYFCDIGHPDQSGIQACRDEYNKKFKNLPLPADLDTIEQVERTIATGDVEDKIKARKQYRVLERAFEK
jgi:hypothetical protein